MKYEGLTAGSSFYYHKNSIYEKFSKAEDFPQIIVDHLKPLLADKIILDLGCGTGKYLKIFSQICKKLYGLDLSSEQLGIAQKKVENKPHINLIQCSAETIPLKENSVDIIVACWFLGTILDLKKRSKILNEMTRVLKKGGKIVLVENDQGGEFEEIRGRINDPEQKTQIYNTWLLKNDFQIFRQFTTYFSFKSFKQAREIFAAIWDKQAGSKVKKSKIEHKIAIFIKNVNRFAK